MLGPIVPTYRTVPIDFVRLVSAECPTCHERFNFPDEEGEHRSPCGHMAVKTERIEVSQWPD